MDAEVCHVSLEENTFYCLTIMYIKHLYTRILLSGSVCTERICVKVGYTVHIIKLCGRVMNQNTYYALITHSKSKIHIFYIYK